MCDFRIKDFEIFFGYFVIGYGRWMDWKRFVYDEWRYINGIGVCWDVLNDVVVFVKFLFVF